jgi:hypothetical protein
MVFVENRSSTHCRAKAWSRSFMSHEILLNESMSQPWQVYRTRFLVRAKRLTRPLSFKDALGREHNGSPGDYLVQSGEELFRIAPREIFEDIYVAMEDGQPDFEGTGMLAPAHEQRLGN